MIKIHFLKSLLSILLGVNLLLAGILPSASYELSKLPQLLDHFEIHQTESKSSISLMDFLVLHYFSEHGKSNHCDIPHLHQHGPAMVFIFSEPSIFTLENLPEVSSQKNEDYLLQYHFSIESSLLQPPQV